MTRTRTATAADDSPPVEEAKTPNAERPRAGGTYIRQADGSLKKGN